MTRDIYECAEFLVAGWRLCHPGKTLPINDGRLDHALNEVKAALPVRFKDVLSFGVSRAGFRCYELTELLHASFNNLLLSAPTPAHSRVDVLIDDTTAHILLRRRGIAPHETQEFANRLSQAIPKS